MQRVILEGWIAEGNSHRQMARKAGRAECTIRYWLRVHGLKTKWKEANAKPGQCRVCSGQLKTSRRNRCPSCDTRVRRLRQKLRAIALLGGKCSKCNWSGPAAGFDFHHVSGIKDFEMGQIANMAWPVVSRELKKCVLLCRCCHAIEHSKHEDPKLLAELAR